MTETRNFQKFLDNMRESGSGNVSQSDWLRRNIDLDEYDLDNCTPDMIEDMLLKVKPRTYSSMLIVCSVINTYAKYIGNTIMSDTISRMDKIELWDKVRDKNNPTFISHNSFLTIYENIDLFETKNVLYSQTLFRSVYEGIYCPNMSVLKNLRSSDVHGNFVTLRTDDGESYQLKISEDLAEDLIEIGSLTQWERINRMGMFTVNMVGEYPDSCFKSERRRNARHDTNYSLCYSRNLNRITKTYLGYNVSPLYLFISGIVYRIGMELKKFDISLEDAFSYNRKDKFIGGIIAKELERCNYKTTNSNFRKLVMTNIQDFENNLQ